MNILVIAFEFPPEGGGIGVYAYQIAKNLSDQGQNITAIALTSRVDESEINAFDRKQNFKIYRVKQINQRLLSILNRLYVTIKVLCKERFDFLYVAHMPAGVLGMIGKYIFRTPYAIVGHGTEILLNDKKNYTRLVYNHSDVVIVNSNYTKQLFLDKNINKPIHVVFPGGDHHQFDPHKYKGRRNELREKLGLSHKFIVMTTGSISERKDHITVVKAIKKISQDYKDICYIIVGDGPYKPQVDKTIAELNLKEYVLFYGFAKIADLPQLYDICDIFILNSKIDRIGDVEGFGIVLIEAGLMEKPVIGVLKTGMEDAVENNKSGILVNMNDPDDTANAILKFYKNRKLCVSMGKYARQRALSKFTWEISGKHTYSILHNYNERLIKAGKN